MFKNMQELTLDQLALVLSGIKDLYFEWTAEEDDIDIKSLVIGYMTAYEGVSYDSARAAYTQHVEPLFDSWDEEYDRLTTKVNEEEFSI